MGGQIWLNHWGSARGWLRGEISEGVIDWKEKDGRTKIQNKQAPTRSFSKTLRQQRDGERGDLQRGGGGEGGGKSIGR